MEKMKLLVFSDSHGNERAMRRALALHPDAEGVLFLGDGLASASLLPELSGDRFFFGVKGNCDSLFGLFSSASGLEFTLLYCSRLLTTAITSFFISAKEGKVELLEYRALLDGCILVVELSPVLYRRVD